MSLQTTIRKTLALAATGGLVLGLLPTAVFGHGAGDVHGGGTVEPDVIPKYVTPLVIPPEMPMSMSDSSVDYQIAVRQFQQQVLPTSGCIAASEANVLASEPAIACVGDAFPMTTLWGYGSVDHPGTVAEGGTFNNPSLTIEATKDKMTRVKWINDLQDESGPLPHLFAIDRTLHYFNAELAVCKDGTRRVDCRPDPLHPDNAGIDFTAPYAGPVPVVTHVHGAHTSAASDGYTEAWYLPSSAQGMVSPVTGQEYALYGTKVNALAGRDGLPVVNTGLGYAIYDYLNDQPSTTLWYHDHSLGLTRLNVAAASAGFWLIREKGKGETGLARKDRNGRPQRLPEKAPRLGDEPGASYYEVPLAIQDRSFNADGSFFYPADRAFFEGLSDGQDPAENPQMTIDFIDDPRFSGSPAPSDISPIWNPEAFFNTMVVNGNTWPYLDVEPRRYRFRLLNANDSRFLNLSLVALDEAGEVLGEVPFYMIGSEQGLLPDVVEVRTGYTITYYDDGSTSGMVASRDDQEALLMGPAERPDTIIDFGEVLETYPDAVAVRMLNTAPDAPFGGFPDEPAMPETTGQVMQFNIALSLRDGDRSTPPRDLVLLDQTEELSEATPSRTRTIALLEEGSAHVCVAVDDEGEFEVPITQVEGTPPDCPEGSDAFGPQAAVLGTVDESGVPSAQLWADAIEQNPELGATEDWEFWNFSADAHPIHIHLVGFEVQGRTPMLIDEESGEPAIPGSKDGAEAPALPWETGLKDTVTALPGEVTRVRATFDLPGLYVWHCHILSHEDNEMMVPYCVGDAETCSGNELAPGS